MIAHCCALMMYRDDGGSAKYISCYTLASHGDVQVQSWIHHQHAVDSTTTASSQPPLPVVDDRMRVLVDSQGTACMSQHGDGVGMMQLLRDIVFRQIDSLPGCMPWPCPLPSHCLVFVVDDDNDGTSEVHQSVPTLPHPNSNPTLLPPVPPKPTNLESRSGRQRADRHGQQDENGQVCWMLETRTPDVSGVIPLADKVRTHEAEQQTGDAVNDTCALPVTLSTRNNRVADRPEREEYNYDKSETESSDDNHDHSDDGAMSERCAAAAAADDDDDYSNHTADGGSVLSSAAVTDDSQHSNNVVSSCCTVTSSPSPSSLLSSAAVDSAFTAGSVDSHISTTGVCVQLQPIAVPLPPPLQSNQTFAEQQQPDPVDSEPKQWVDTGKHPHRRESDAAAAAEPACDSTAARAADIERLYSLVRKKKAPSTGRHYQSAAATLMPGSLIANDESIKLPLGRAASATGVTSLQKYRASQPGDEIQQAFSVHHYCTTDTNISSSYRQASSSSSSSSSADVPSLVFCTTTPTTAAVRSSQSLEPAAFSAPSASSSSLRAGDHVTTSMTSKTGGAGARPPSHHQIRLLRGSLLLPATNNTTSDSLTRPVDTAVDCLLAYDRQGRAFYVPANEVKVYGDPAGEAWFYPVPLTPLQATVLLQWQTDGCFVVYRTPTSLDQVQHSCQYCLAVCNGPDVLHYDIVSNPHGDLSLAGHRHSFLMLSDLVSYFQHNQSSLATRLGRPLSQAHLPLAADLGGFDVNRYELERSQLRLTGHIIANGRHALVCAGSYRSQPVAVKVQLF